MDVCMFKDGKTTKQKTPCEIDPTTMFLHEIYSMMVITHKPREKKIYDEIL